MQKKIRIYRERMSSCNESEGGFAAGAEKFKKKKNKSKSKRKKERTYAFLTVSLSLHFVLGCSDFLSHAVFFWGGYYHPPLHAINFLLSNVGAVIYV